MISTQSIIQFSSDIEIVVGLRKISYLEAIMEYIDEKRIDMDIVPKLMSPALKNKLEREASELNLLHKENKLPGLV